MNMNNIFKEFKNIYGSAWDFRCGHYPGDMVYFFNIKGTDIFKIGYASCGRNLVLRRMNTFNEYGFYKNYKYENYKIVGVIYNKDYKNCSIGYIETEIHERFKKNLFLRREGFLISLKKVIEVLKEYQNKKDYIEVILFHSELKNY